MNILHIIGSLDPAGGGPPAVALRLAAAQAAQGHVVAVATQRSEKSQEAIDLSLRSIPGIENVQVTFLPSALEGILPGNISLGNAISGFDILHIHGVWGPLPLRVAAAARRIGKPYVVAPHGMLYGWSLARKPLKKRLGLAFAYRRMLNGAAAFHALNFDEAIGMEPLKLRPGVCVIPNGIFPQEFQSLPQPGEFRHEFPQIGAADFVLFLGRLHPCKGLLGLLAGAFAAAAAQVPSLQLVVAGPDAGARAAFEREVRERGIANRVHIIGPVYGRRKLQLLTDATCFCLPSEHETFSMAILEALAVGLPAIISDATHFPEIAEANAGLTVPLTRYAFALAIVEVSTNAAMRARMACAGRALVTSRFTWPRIADEAIKAYGKLLEHHRADG